MEKKLFPKRTKILFLILGIVAVLAIIFGIWYSYKIKSSALGLPFCTISVNGIFANLSGKVTDKGTGKAISGATVAIASTNDQTISGCGLHGTKTSVSSGGDGAYNLTKSNGSHDIKIRSEIGTPLPGIGTSYKYIYTFTISAAGYKTLTASGASWGSEYGQGATLPNKNFELEKGTNTPAGTSTFKAPLYVTVSGTRSMACMGVVQGGVCTVNLTITPNGSKQWTGVGRSSGNDPGPVSVSEQLSAGTYQITGGNILSTTGASYNLSKVNGSPIPYSFTMPASGTYTAVLDFVK